MVAPGSCGRPGNPVNDDLSPVLSGAIVERTLVSKLPGVFCLEGEWSPDLRSRWSVEPILQLLERLGYLTAIHRDVASKAELTYYLRKWVQRGYAASTPRIVLLSRSEQAQLQNARSGVPIACPREMKASSPVFSVGASPSMLALPIEKHPADRCRCSQSRLPPSYTSQPRAGVWQAWRRWRLGIAAAYYQAILRDWLVAGTRLITA